MFHKQTYAFKCKTHTIDDAIKIALSHCKHCKRTYESLSSKRENTFDLSHLCSFDDYFVYIAMEVKVRVISQVNHEAVFGRAVCHYFYISRFQMPVLC